MLWNICFRGILKMAKRKKNSVKKTKKYYNVPKMSVSERYLEIQKILKGDYDNWKSFGYSGGLCSGK